VAKMMKKLLHTEGKRGKWNSRRYTQDLFGCFVSSLTKAAGMKRKRIDIFTVQKYGHSCFVHMTVSFRVFLQQK